MKKMILTLAIALGSLSAFAGEGNVSQKVLDAFNQEFTTANQVEWASGTNYYRASFIYNSKHVFAYYDLNGALLALTRYITSLDLPMGLQNSLKKDYDSYWISDLFEVAKEGATHYYITLENADSKLVLESSAGYEWETFKTIKKI
jgi:hypothetical protein